MANTTHRKKPEFWKTQTSAFLGSLPAIPDLPQIDARIEIVLKVKKDVSSAISWLQQWKRVLDGFTPGERSAVAEATGTMVLKVVEYLAAMLNHPDEVVHGVAFGLCPESVLKTYLEQRQGRWYPRE
ncbi:MAG: hypothetical protein NTY04_04270 [Candidatus Staskawiczbacteria bacterium]|nr:hypothetical protein [Candidatus Staskawiczbacteria bacterium]